jgi:MFS family permease
MTVGAGLACLTGLVAGRGPAIVILVTSLYVLAIMADSAALTAGLIEVSPPEARGTAMAVYSFFGFAGALMGPIVFGALLDAGGGAASQRAWLLAFAGIAAVSLCGVAVLGRTSASPLVDSLRTSWPIDGDSPCSCTVPCRCVRLAGAAARSVCFRPGEAGRTAGHCFDGVAGRSPERSRRRGHRRGR